MNRYKFYDHNELFNKLNEIDDVNEDVVNFIKTFSFVEINNLKLSKTNSTYVFNSIIKEDTTKSKIINLLNKLSQNNLNKIITSIREIPFQTVDEINELINQLIIKIKKDNELNRSLTGQLCASFILLHFETLDKNKISFREIFLKQIKKEYLESINFSSNTWTKETSEKIMILLAALFNTKEILNNDILNSVINDLKNFIVYKKDQNEEYYMKVECSIQLLNVLVLTIKQNNDIKNIFLELINFLTEQMKIYEEVKCITKKMRLICKNMMFELSKNINEIDN